MHSSSRRGRLTIRSGRPLGRYDAHDDEHHLPEDGNELVLGPWRGPQATEHVRIPVGEGICGAAAASGATEVVDDVAADARYLACFPSTRSEIVVPVVRDGRVIGEIDVDSDEPGAFDDADRVFLERVGALLALVDDDPASTVDRVFDEWGRASFPASDPPPRWAGADVRAAASNGR